MQKDKLSYEGLCRIIAHIVSISSARIAIIKRKYLCGGGGGDYKLHSVRRKNLKLVYGMK